MIRNCLAFLRIVILIINLPGHKSHNFYDHVDYLSRIYSSAFPYRIYRLIKEHYEDVSRRMEQIHDIRFSHEESVLYEYGYIMSEILERYRKLVEDVKRPFTFKSDAVFDTMKQIESIQYLYFEIYHLVNMMHELPRKYGYSQDLVKLEVTQPSTVKYDRKKVEDALKQLENNKEKREKNKKKRLKEMKKIREMMLKGKFVVKKVGDKKPKNKWWPIDYGWEIDYYWKR